MKKLFCLILMLSLAFSALAQTTDEEREKIELSYAFGILVAYDLMDMAIDFDYDAFILGFRQYMENEDTEIDIYEAMEIISAIFEVRQERIAEENLAIGLAFLEENSRRPGVIVTPSGLQYELISEGHGEMPNIADHVLVHYVGTNVHGEIFDSTHEYGEPLELPLYRVIPGWSEGLRLMREGERAILYIPADLAYGPTGYGGYIAPNAVLIFDVELLSIVQ